MSKKFVILSDLHAHTWTAFAKGDGLQNTRLRRALDILYLSLETAREEGIPWLFAGDIVHTAGFVLNPVLFGVTDVLADFPEVPKYAVWGNHDARGKGGRISLEETVWSSLVRTIPNLTVLDDSSAEVQGLTIYGAGFQPKNSLLNLGEGGDIGIFHQTIFGSRTPSGFALSEGITAEELAKRYQVSIVGHIHHKQEMDIPGEKVVLIPGSPEHHDFGDSGEYGWWIFEYGPPHQVEFVSGGSPQFLTVDSPGEITDDGNFYRVRNVTDKSSLPTGVAFIAPEPTTVERRNLLRNATKVEEVVHIWLEENPPFAHSDDCALGAGGEGCDCPAIPMEYVEVGTTLLGAQDPPHLRKVWARQLTLDNFISYEHEKFDIEPGLWLLSGENGVGKSSLAGEALFWLLTGKNTKDASADEVVRRAPGVTKCRVSGLFEEVDGTYLLVERERELNGGPSVRVVQGMTQEGPGDFHGGHSWEAPGSREMTTKLMDYLGLSENLFLNLGYFSQENLLLLSSATDGERKDVLAHLMGLSSYQEAAQAAGAEASRREASRELKSTVFETREKDLEEAREKLSQVEEVSEGWERTRISSIHGRKADLGALQNDPAVLLQVERVEALERRIQVLVGWKKTAFQTQVPKWSKEILQALEVRTSEYLEKLESQIRTHLQFFEQRGTTEVQVRGLSIHLPRMKEKVEEVGLELKQAKEALSQANVTLMREEALLLSLRETVEGLERERDQAATHFEEGHCPTCGQDIGEEHREACRAPFEEKIRVREEKIEISGEAIALSHENVTSHSSTVTNFQKTKEDLDSKITSLQEEMDRLGWLDEHCRQKEQTAEGMEALKVQADEKAQRRFEQFVEEYVEGKGKWVEKIHTFLRGIQEAHAEKVRVATEALRRIEEASNPHLTTLQAYRERIDSLEKHSLELQVGIKTLSKEIAVYSYWVKGFGKQGIQSLQMEEIAGRFNDIRGLIIPSLTQGVFDVQFSTISRTGKGDLREKTDFFVYKDGEPFPYGGLSGGERRRVDIGIMLTMVCAVSEWMDVPGLLGLMTMDEVFVFLDASGAEGLMEALRQVLTLIPTIFIMTHDDKFQSLFSNVINIQKDPETGISGRV